MAPYCISLGGLQVKVKNTFIELDDQQAEAEKRTSQTCPDHWAPQTSEGGSAGSTALVKDVGAAAVEAPDLMNLFSKLIAQDISQPSSTVVLAKCSLPGTGLPLTDVKGTCQGLCEEQRPPRGCSQGEWYPDEEDFATPQHLYLQSGNVETAAFPTSMEDMQEAWDTDAYPAEVLPSCAAADKSHKLPRSKASKSRSRKATKRWCHLYINPVMLQEGFELSKKVIGHAGYNTRRIFQATNAKIRYRGRGSGHWENGKGFEAPVPLMLAVTSEMKEDSKHFLTAVEMAGNLLDGITGKYVQFCKKWKLQHPEGPLFWIGELSQDAKECMGLTAADTSTKLGSLELPVTAKDPVSTTCAAVRTRHTCMRS
eukprot:TRINITY_DN9068_c0_g1_i7.p1 TRINITY_DN9068_c0_g1~~TRINITY_DN9068_c0_g1_i7.p1  ORF type:complete len:381 (-),score=80.72 TRINITY_DN9068_c0_g1_i7:211-1314(-)